MGDGNVNILGLDIETAGLKSGTVEGDKLEASMVGVAVAATKAETAIEGTASAGRDLAQSSNLADTALKALMTDTAANARSMAGLDATMGKFLTTAQSMVASVDRLGQELSSMGQQARKTSDDIEDYSAHMRAAAEAAKDLQQKQESFLSSLKNQASTIGLSRTELLSYKAAQLGVGAQAAADIDKLVKFETGLKGTAKAAGLTTQELINLSYQFQDFGVQVASGGNMLVAFVQQASQASGVFAQAGARGVGFGQAISSAVTSVTALIARFAPLILGLGAVAAGVAAVVFVMKQMHDGAEESISVINALSATGNAAGVTTAQFYSLGDSIAESTSKSAKSVRALELEVIRSGKATSENLGLITESAIQLSKAMGVDASNALKTLMPLLGNTQAAAADLNEQFHFLTLAEYEHIAALQASGDKAGAVKVAFEALQSQLGDQVKNLGFVEQAWRGVGLMIQAAIDKVAAFGRVQTQDDKMTAKQRAIVDEMTSLQQKQDQTEKGNISGRGAFNDQDAGRLTFLQNQKRAWDALNDSVSKFNVTENKRKDVEQSLMSMESSGKFGQMVSLKEKQSNLEYAIANGIGNQVKNAQLLKGINKEIADLEKSTYGGPAKTKKGRAQYIDQDPFSDYYKDIAKEAQKVADAQSLITALIGQSAVRAAEFQAAYEQGGEAAVDWLQTRNDLLDKNKDAFAALLPYQRDGLIFTDAQVAAQNALADVLTKQLITQRQIAAARQLSASIDKQEKDFYRSQAAFSIGGASSFDQLQLATQLMQQNKDLSQATAMSEAARLITLGKQTTELEKQVARAKDLSSEKVLERAADGLTSASDSFWEAFAAGDKDALRNVGADITRLFQSAAADGLKAGFEPALTYLKDNLKIVFSRVFDDMKTGLDAILTKIGVYKKDKDGKTVVNTDGALGKVVQTAGTIYAGYQLGSAGASALGLGGKSAAQQQNGNVGGAIGAAIGSIWGPIGSAIGSFLGKALGGLLGPSKSYNWAESNLNQDGSLKGSIFGSKRTNETTSALTDAIGGITAAASAIKDLGGTLGVTITKASMSNYSSDYTDSKGKKYTAAASAADLANAAGLTLLKNTTFATTALNQIKDGLISAGKNFDDTVNILNSVQDVLDSTKPALSEWQTQLKNLTDLFNPLIAETGSYSTALKDALATAKAALAANFNTDISTQLLAAQSPVAAQYADMLKTQAERVKDATALGGNLTNVYALNAQEVKNFIKNLSGSTTDIGSLTTAFNELIAAAKKAGQDTKPITDAFNQTKAGMAADFNSSIGDSLLQASNGTLYNVEQMLKTQKQRLADAAALGANIVAVQRLNAIETANFFKDLSSTEKLQLGDYLGLIEDYTGKIGVLGQQLISALDPMVNNLSEQVATLNESASTLNGLAKTIGDTKASIEDKYGNVTPLASLQGLRAQFQDTAAKAIGGDQTAMGDLSELANKLIERSRSIYGSTQPFGSDFDLVTKLLGEAQGSATTQADAATAQAAALQDQIGLLTEIKNILGDPNPQLATLSADLLKLSDANVSLKDMLGQYLALQGAQSAATLSDAQTQALALLIATSAANSNAVSQASTNANIANGQATASTAAGASSTTATGSATDAAAMAGYFQMLLAEVKSGDAAALTVLNLLYTEFRNVSKFLQQQTTVKAA